MYAIGPSNSRPRPCHKGARTALMHSINVITSSSLKRRQKSPAVVSEVRAQRMYAVSWRKRSTQGSARDPTHGTADAPSAARHRLNQTQLGDQPTPRRAPEAHRVAPPHSEHRLAPSVPVPCLAVSSSPCACAGQRGSETIFSSPERPPALAVVLIRNPRFSFLGQSRQSRLLD